MKIIKHGFGLKGRVRVTKRNYITKKITYRSKWQNNIMPDVGIIAILRRLSDDGSKTNEGMITYGALGNGASAVNAGDTIMENEIVRKPVAVHSITDLTLSLEFYFTNSEGNDTITKWALFGEDATSAINTGTMFEYIAFSSSFTKTSAEDLTVEIQITGASL